MASHRRPKQPGRTRATVITATAAAAVAMTANTAQADPGDDRRGVKAEVDRLHEDAAVATEKYNGAQEKADKLQEQVDKLQDSVARGQGELNELRNGLGSMATAQYRSGGLDPSVQLFLSSDPDEYLERASALDQLSGKQIAALKKIQDKQRLLEQQREDAGEKLADLSETRKELAAQKKKVQGKLADAQKLLNKLTEEERQAMREQEQRASRAAGERAVAGNAASASEAPPVTGRASSAYQAATTRVGMPYAWGAEGPNAFDCSGLIKWSYRQAGISVPRTSQAQASAGTRINSMSDLRVGDLVILRNDLGHVAFYAGNGQMLHAPYPGAPVRFEAISTSGMPFMWGVRI
ncbi:NlpC/P60 family protein [Streptomyces sp. TRM 70351]|uniref:C40 family peptidase n=1 Tax=Streptomyces sp. TRM 70351 TaxID=3116552 RepID=UPI002E7BD82B|nr:NlpC/P60 family protein [Streptomyces sp. TRM 70351]MEE1928693.1 NlpC/P60 family protein [Streptomyces sp. TRM 70351]